MDSIKRGGFIAAKADSPELYAGLRELWCSVFGDEPGYVDAVFDAFGEDIEGHVITDPDGKVVSSLVCYTCGTYCSAHDPEEEQPDDADGRPVSVIYAVCTDPGSRGMGLAGMLVSRVRDQIIERGGIPLVSPAEPSLEEYYEGLGFMPHFGAARGMAFPDEGYGEGWDEDEDEDFEAFEPEMSVLPVSVETYSRYREAFLADVPHVALNDGMLRLIAREAGEDCGFFVINGGDAVCTMMRTEAGYTAEELLVNPVLSEISMEIDGEIASRLARHIGCFGLPYRTPGAGYCQSMTAATAEAYGLGRGRRAYFGFPLE